MIVLHLIHLILALSLSLHTTITLQYQTSQLGRVGGSPCNVYGLSIP